MDKQCSSCGGFCRKSSCERENVKPEPEPFEYWNAVEGWVKIDEVRQHFDTAGCGTIYKTGGEGRVPLYTTPQREWQGLTDEEIESLWDNTLSEDVGITALRKSALAIEAKLKEKNAPNL